MTLKTTRCPCPTLLNVGNELSKGDLSGCERVFEGGSATRAIGLVVEGVTQVQADQGFGRGVILAGCVRDQGQTPSRCSFD